MMRVIRAMFFFCAKINLNIMLTFIPGHLNVNADNLSRLQVQKFLRDNPSVNHHPSQIPDDVWKI